MIPTDRIDAGTDAGTVAALLADCSPMLVDSTAATGGEDRTLIGAVLPVALASLRKRAAGEEKPVALPGWTHLQALLGGGLWPGCHLIAGAPGTRKTQLCLQLALCAAQDGVPTAMVALEMDAPGLVARLLCIAAPEAAPRPWSALCRAELPVAELERLAAVAWPRLAHLPLHIEASAKAHGWAHDQIGAAVSRLRRGHPERQDGPVLLIIDFMQLVGSPEGAGREDARERLAKVAYEAREAARTQNAVIVLVSSIARSNYDGLSLTLDATGKPTTPPRALLAVGKESGDIEFAVDTAMVLAPSETDANAVWVAVAKQRAGETGWVRLSVVRELLNEGDDRGPTGSGSSTARRHKPTNRQPDRQTVRDNDDIW